MKSAICTGTPHIYPKFLFNYYRLITKLNALEYNNLKVKNIPLHYFLCALLISFNLGIRIKHVEFEITQNIQTTHADTTSKISAKIDRMISCKLVPVDLKKKLC